MLTGCNNCFAKYEKCHLKQKNPSTSSPTETIQIIQWLNTDQSRTKTSK